MNWQQIIVSDNNILSGKPIVKNTRISVELIMQLLSMGWTETEILENYPNLNKESLLAIYAYAYDLVHDSMLLPAI